MAPRSLSGFVDRLDEWQQKRLVPGFLVGVVAKYRDDRGQQYAALLSYYGFISMFPLLIAFVSILSWLLEDDPTLRDKIIDSLIGRLPVISTEIKSDVGDLKVHGAVLLLGLATLLWAGLKVVRNGRRTRSTSSGGCPTSSARGWSVSRFVARDARRHRRLHRGCHGSDELRRVRDLPGFTKVSGAVVAIALNVLLWAPPSSS